ncbi:MAG: sortase B protein-sorting domain-containing protein [Oscillospiraceae bacterium]|nr:sortase B protein-sorting domain-containing protein [Oscillospiraceae bacterium]
MRSEPAVAPTCTEQGHKAFYHCTTCMGIYADENGDEELSYEDLVLPPEHTRGESVNENVKASTCTKSGSYEEVVRCAVCGEILSREAKTGESALGHDYSEAKWVWADDCSAAQAVFVCTRDPAHRKTVNAGITEEKTEATCTEAGSIVYTASASFEGKAYTDSKTKTVPAASHTAGTAVKENEKAATCTEKGSYDLVTRCSSCGAELKRTHAEEKALGHAWSEWKHGETADYRECTRCKLKETKGTKACDHLMIIEPAVEPTCIAQGHKVFYHCAKCMGIYADKDGNQELLYEHVILPAKGHTAGIPSRQNEQPATCTESGTFEEIITCTVCEETLSSEIRTGEPALGHDYVLSAWDWAEDYTAEAIFICRRDPSHQVVVSADVSVKRAEPSCLVEGSETYTATVNFEGTIYQDTEIKALKKTGHIPKSPVTENETGASCTLDGFCEKVIYCSYCGMELSREIEIIKAPGVHTWSAWKSGETGYIRTCSVCRLEEKKQIETCTHSGNIIPESKAATCTETGMKEHYRCKNCHELFSDAEGTHLLSDAELRNLVIPALGHEGGNPERINIRPATCTQPGSYDEAVYCTRCGNLLSLTHCDDAVEPLGHAYGDPVWNWTDDNSAATATFTCSRDAGHQRTEKAEIVVTRMEPGCEEDGWMHVFASVWRNGILYYDEKQADLPKTGHKEAPPVRINIVQAGCETAGSYDEAVYCEHCGKLFSSIHHENAVPLLGHLWSAWTKQGDKLTRTCSRCEAVQEIGDAPHVHQMKPDPGKEAACIETGVAPGFVCTICGGHFADEDGTQEAESLPLKAHTPGEVEILFDPEDLNGYYECVYCTVCGTMLSLDWVDVPDHGEGYLGYYYSDTTRVWVKGSRMPAAFTVKRSALDEQTYNLFRYISIDGATVDRRFYTRARGSLVLTLLPDYLETLSVGRHTLTTVFNDGQASADFVVITPGSGSGSYSGSGTIDYIYNPQAKTVSDNPRTGDDSRLALWGILAAVSAAGVMVLTAKKRKRREN